MDHRRRNHWKHLLQYLLAKPTLHIEFFHHKLANCLLNSRSVWYHFFLLLQSHNPKTAADISSKLTCQIIQQHELYTIVHHSKRKLNTITCSLPFSSLCMVGGERGFLILTPYNDIIINKVTATLKLWDEKKWWRHFHKRKCFKVRTNGWREIENVAKIYGDRWSNVIVKAQSLNGLFGYQY